MRNLLSTIRWDYSLWPSCFIWLFWNNLGRFIKVSEIWSFKTAKPFWASLYPWDSFKFTISYLEGKNDKWLKNEKPNVFRINDGVSKIAHFDFPQERFHEGTELAHIEHCNQHIQYGNVLISVEIGCSLFELMYDTVMIHMSTLIETKV